MQKSYALIAPAMTRLCIYATHELVKSANTLTCTISPLSRKPRKIVPKT